MKRYIPVKKSKNESSSQNSHSGLVEKGSNDAIRIHTDDIERTISRLRDNHTISLDNLPNELEIEVKKLRGWAENFIGTETYPDFYKIILKHFSDLDNIIPGTIGSFCYGCSHSAGFEDNKPCSATCVNSIPPPNIPTWVECDSNVSLLYINGDVPTPTINWHDIHTVGTNKLTYIFVMSGPQSTKITDGMLKDKGIRSYSIYRVNNGLYTHIRTGTVGRVSGNKKLTTRKNEHVYEEIVNKDRKKQLIGYSAIYILVMLLVLILIIRLTRK